MDSGEVFSVKGGTKLSFCGGSLMSGKQLPTLVIASKKLDASKIDLEKYSPTCKIIDPTTGKPFLSRFIDTPSGGMEMDTNVDYVKTMLTPAMGGKRKRESDPFNVQCCDGLGQHLCFKVLKACQEDDQKIALRFSHGSHMNQKEDFVNYAQFKPAFEAAKGLLQKERVDKVITAAMSKNPPVKPASKDMQAAALLSDEDVLACALKPWAAAFNEANNLRGWQEEGIFPLFDRRLYWTLLDKEAGKTMTEQRVLIAEPNPKTLVAYGLRPATGEAAATSTALLLPEENLLDEDSIKAEARLQADAILAGGGTPDSLPRLTAGDAFKMKGSATGRDYKMMARAKETEKWRNVYLQEARSKKTTERKEIRKSDDVIAANKVLTLLIEKGMDFSNISNRELNSGDLQGYLAYHGIKVQSKADERKLQVMAHIASAATGDEQPNATMERQLKAVVDHAERAKISLLPVVEALLEPATAPMLTLAEPGNLPDAVA